MNKHMGAEYDPATVELALAGFQALNELVPRDPEGYIVDGVEYVGYFPDGVVPDTAEAPEVEYVSVTLPSGKLLTLSSNLLTVIEPRVDWDRWSEEVCIQTRVVLHRLLKLDVDWDTAYLFRAGIRDIFFAFARENGKLAELASEEEYPDDILHENIENLIELEWPPREVLQPTYGRAGDSFRLCEGRFLLRKWMTENHIHPELTAEQRTQFVRDWRRSLDGDSLHVCYLYLAE